MEHRGDIKDTICVPFVSLYIDIELLSAASCLALYTSLNWSGKEDLSLSSGTEISFQGQAVGGKGHGSPVSSHLPLMHPQPNSRETQDSYSADELNLLEPEKSTGFLLVMSAPV